MPTPTYRIFSIVAYNDSETLDFNHIVNRLLELNYRFFYICHDKDLIDNNYNVSRETKKLHYHIAVYFDKPTTIKKVSTDLNIDETKVNVKDDSGKRYILKNTIGYFLHYKMKDKYNYDIKDIYGNCEDLVNKYYDILSDNDNDKRDLKSILAFIEDNKIDNIKDLLMYCIDNNCVNTLKKYQYLFSILIKEQQRI